MRALILAASLVITVPVAVAADAQPPRHGWHGRDDRHGHRHRVCRTYWHHGHRVRTCR